MGKEIKERKRKERKNITKQDKIKYKKRNEGW